MKILFIYYLAMVVYVFIHYFFYNHNAHLNPKLLIVIKLLLFLTSLFSFVLQATIGIDFLSKTMYLEDRTVSSVFSVHFSATPQDRMLCLKLSSVIVAVRSTQQSCQSQRTGLEIIYYRMNSIQHFEFFILKQTPKGRESHYL